MKRIIRALMIFLLLIGLVLGLAYLYLMRGQSAVLEETLEPIDFSTIEDGTYTGHYQRYRWTVTLEVTVEAGQIIDIDVLESGWPLDANQAILLNRIKAASHLEDVDVVAGWTISSIAHLKALEDALGD